MLTDRHFGEHDYTPGGELFRTDRRVRIWAQTVTHGQLLLRAIDNVQPTRIDLLFKDVQEQRLRTSYDGLIVGCATEAESVGTCFVLESGDVRDHVRAESFSWQEEEQTDVGPRSLISLMTPQPCT